MADDPLANYNPVNTKPNPFGEKLTADNLLKLLKAQCGDDECAAFFGFATQDGKIDIEKFLKAVDDAPDLRSAYAIGRKSGLADFKVSQAELALADKTTSQWWGKQYAGQSEKVEGKITIERVTIEAGRESEAYRKLIGGGMPVIDVTSEEVVDGQG